MLKAKYFPTHDENLMEYEGDVERARHDFLKNRPAGLQALLEQRYLWMNRFLEGREKVVEFGSGAGFSKEFLQCPGLILTDVVKRPWIDKVADALQPPFEDGSLDVIICSHMIHHLSSPVNFFSAAHKKLKPGGLILIQDLHTSLLLRFLLKSMRHEGWSYDINVFDRHAIANDPQDPWSANCAIPEILFRDEGLFLEKISGFQFLKNELNEAFLLPLSGGVIAKKKVLQFPPFFYQCVCWLDAVLVKAAPQIFAMGRSVVLQKVEISPKLKLV